MTLTMPHDAVPSELVVRPLTPTIGAVVDGIDLAHAIDGVQAAELRAAITRHRVVFVRDQRLDVDAQLALAGHLGQVAVGPLQQLLGSDRRTSVIVDDRHRPPAGFDWHTDLSWTKAPPSYGVLHALEVPPVGGDTLWVDLAACFASLPTSVQDTCRELRAAHSPDRNLLGSVERHHGPDVAIRLLRAHPAVAHPLVRAHAITGEPLLFLSPLYVTHLVGIDRRRGERLLRELDRTLDDPHHQVRWSWRPGDVAIWDEAATCHRALTDHFPQRRVMRRCTVEGSTPRAGGGDGTPGPG